MSGTSISFGTKTVFDQANAYFISAAYDPDEGGVVIGYQDYSASPFTLKAVRGTVSGTSISFTSPVDPSVGRVRNQIGVVYDTNANQAVIAYGPYDTNDGEAIVVQIGSTNLTSENFIGTARSPAADGDSVVVNTQGAIDGGQTGLTAGQGYYVQIDGTLSTTAGDPSVFAGTAVSATKLIVKG